MKAVERREQIRDHAQALFREKGYAATSMRDLAVELGIEAASLYNHVASKDEILRDICFSMAGAFFEASLPVLASEATPMAKLQNLLQAHLGVIAANRDAAAVFLFEWRHLAEPALAEFKQLRKRYEKQFLSLIEEGIASGAFRDVDPRVAIRTMLSATNWTYEWIKSSTKASEQQMILQVSQLLVAGIAK